MSDYRIYSPWNPMDNKVDLKTIGKLGEESGELSTVVSRCIIQGMDGVNPDNGKINRVWLTEEIADVEVNIKLVKERFALDQAAITERSSKKEPLIRAWHIMAGVGQIT